MANGIDAFLDVTARLTFAFFGEADLFLEAVLLFEGGWMLCCTNFRGITENDFMRMIAMPNMQPAAMPKDFPEESYLKSIWVG